METIEARSGGRSGEGPSPPPSSRQSTAARGASLRALRGRVCPRCRDVLDEDAPRSGRRAGALERCPTDGLAYVPAQSLADADGDPFLGATIAGRYVVVGKLGSGSMGTVYRARHEAMARDVALKILRLDRAIDVHAKARFTREARAMSLLASPYTVVVFDFGEVPPLDDHLTDEGSLYLAMELLEGESLGARLKRLGRIPKVEAIRIARHALTSLGEAHDKGIIHRDLKPDNFFLTKVENAKEICKVLDFGIAKIMGEPEGIDAAETQAGTVFGTPRYMSPEQAQGKAPDARGDLYSLGVVLYHMLVGRPPFTDGDAVVVMAHHIKSTPKRASEAAPDAGIDPALDAIVMRALAKDPADRWPSAKAFLAALAALDETTMASVPPPPKPPIALEDAFVSSPSIAEPKRSSRRTLGASVAVSAVAIAALLALGPLRPARDPVPLARASIALVAAARRLAVLKAEAAQRESAEAARRDEPVPPALPSASAPPPSPPPAPRQPAKRQGYKRFD